MLTVVLLLLSAIPVFSVLEEPSGEAELLSANLSCTSDQTECLFGCCPYAEAECCANGFECCQHGQTCIPTTGICIGLVGKKKEDIALVFSKATRVENLITPCPSGSTTCGIGKCCPSPVATCCEDGEHCCPYGYRCDIPNKDCLKNVDNYYSVETSSSEMSQTVRKISYKLCPGGARQCPNNMSCCLNDEGDWSCCPNPSLSVYRKKGSNDCCLNLLLQPICCGGILPICTPFGCF